MCVSHPSSLPTVLWIQLEDYWSEFEALPPSNKAISKFHKIPLATFSYRSVCNNILLHVDHIGEAMPTQLLTDVLAREAPPHVWVVESHGENQFPPILHLCFQFDFKSFVSDI